MKKRIIYSLLIIILILGLFFGYHYLNKSSFIKTNNTNDKQIIDSRLAILIESVPGSGNYENATSFSSSGYYINTELTKCDHGSEITWNSENQTISLSSDGDDKCHLYFEAILESIAITTNPTTTTYNKGATFSNSGMVVTATYSNNYSKAITDYNYTAPSLADAGTKNIPISYTDNNITKTTNLSIIVLELWKKYNYSTNITYPVTEHLVGTYSGNTGISCQYGRKYCDHPFFTGGYSVDEDGNITSRTSESVGSSLSSGTYYFDFPCETAIDGIRYENVYKAVITASTNLTLSSWYDWDTGYYTCIESMKSNGVTLYLLMPIKQTNYVLGSYIEDIYAVVGTYPDNGTSGSYWYIKQ